MKFDVEFYDKRRKPQVVEAKNKEEAVLMVQKLFVKAGFALSKSKN